MHNPFIRLLPAVALCVPLAALAQGADPADRTASAPALRYQSAFSDYKPWQDLKPGDWRALNEKVRDAAAPAPKASAPALPGHGGHRMHGGKP